jgi:hypothetical protein
MDNDCNIHAHHTRADNVNVREQKRMYGLQQQPNHPEQTTRTGIPAGVHC